MIESITDIKYINEESDSYQDYEPNEWDSDPIAKIRSLFSKVLSNDNFHANNLHIYFRLTIAV